MGGLFSSKPDPTPDPVESNVSPELVYRGSTYTEPPRAVPSYNQQPSYREPPKTVPSYNQQPSYREPPKAVPSYGSPTYRSLFDGLKIFQINPTKEINKRDIDQFTPQNWNAYGNSKVSEIPTTHPEHENIVNMIKKSTQDHLQIQTIHRIENDFLLLQYQLKKEELTKLHGDCKEVSLFHGTSMVNMTEIINNNFDWRKHGENKGHRFGQGVSFSPLASYASHYTAENIYGGNKLILAKVLITKKCVGDQFTKLPPEGYDTTESDTKKVVVKYDDHTFYPAYVISYAGKVPSLNSLKKQRQRERAEERRRREDEASLALTRVELDWLLKEMEHLEQIILSNRNSTRRRK